MRAALTINEIITHYQWNYIFNINLSFFAWFSRTALSSLTLNPKPRSARTPPKHQLPPRPWPSSLDLLICEVKSCPRSFTYDSCPILNLSQLQQHPRPVSNPKTRWRTDNFFLLESSVPYLPPSVVWFIITQSSNHTSPGFVVLVSGVWESGFLPRVITLLLIGYIRSDTFFFF
jgi:hypothetical protein